MVTRNGAERVYIAPGTVLPWAVSMEHDEDPVCELLVAEARRRRGKQLPAEIVQGLDGWIAVLREERLVVAYDREEGFSVVPAREGIDLDIVREPPPLP